MRLVMGATMVLLGATVLVSARANAQRGADDNGASQRGVVGRLCVDGVLLHPGKVHGAPWDAGGHRVSPGLRAAIEAGLQKLLSLSFPPGLGVIASRLGWQAWSASGRPDPYVIVSVNSRVVLSLRRRRAHNNYLAQWHTGNCTRRLYFRTTDIVRIRVLDADVVHDDDAGMYRFAGLPSGLVKKRLWRGLRRGQVLGLQLSLQE